MPNKKFIILIILFLGLHNYSSAINDNEIIKLSDEDGDKDKKKRFNKLVFDKNKLILATVIISGVLIYYIPPKIKKNIIEPDQQKTSELQKEKQLSLANLDSAETEKLKSLINDFNIEQIAKELEANPKMFDDKIWSNLTAKYNEKLSNKELNYDGIINKPSLLKGLIDHGIDVNKLDMTGFSFLHKAAAHINEAAVDILLDHKDTNPNNTDNKIKNTALHWIARFGLSDEHKNILQKLLDDPRTDVNAQEGLQKRTPLHLAVFYGNPDNVKVLLKHKNINVNIQDTSGKTALSEAITMGHQAIFDALLDHNYTNVNVKDQQGETPLHELSYNNLLDSEKNIPKLIKKGADINAHNAKKYTPLHQAVNANNLKAVQALIVHPNLNINARAVSNYTPLHMAVQIDNIELVKALLKRKDIKINAKNTQGQTALDLAKSEEIRNYLRTVITR